jgi:hypothetical protein
LRESLPVLAWLAQCLAAFEADDLVHGELRGLVQLLQPLHQRGVLGKKCGVEPHNMSNFTLGSALYLHHFLVGAEEGGHIVVLLKP